MNRRNFITTAARVGTAAAILPATTFSATDAPKGLILSKSRLTPPNAGSIPVAILISAGLNVIDFSGPWGVFESVSLPGKDEPPFHLLTVAETAEPITSGSGLKLVPDYTFANVPPVKVVVIPAQRGSEAMREWLKKIALTADITMSVCTGAFHLAKAGLLAGKTATTHHEFLDKLQREFPDVEVKRDVRFVEGEKISTAAGLTSGTDLALRVVERYFGRQIAQTTAAYMEYDGKGWIV
ncbi:MAG TPA: DJ-1/PfpI family protein [Chthoniobacterales bacterium]|nr:DJ-1/PfpI family protein [Chthoniobacterales bacterium]